MREDRGFHRGYPWRTYELPATFNTSRIPRNMLAVVTGPADYIQLSNPTLELPVAGRDTTSATRRPPRATGASTTTLA